MYPCVERENICRELWFFEMCFVYSAPLGKMRKSVKSKEQNSFSEMNSKVFLLKYSVLQKRCPGTYLAHSNCLARAVPQLDFIHNRLMSTLIKTIAATLFTNHNTENKGLLLQREDAQNISLNFAKCVNMGNLFLRKRLKCGYLQSRIGER